MWRSMLVVSINSSRTVTITQYLSKEAFSNIYSIRGLNAVLVDALRAIHLLKDPPQRQ
jgi:hypothetical protein